MANVTDIIEGSDSSTIKVSMKRVETKTTCDGKNICHSNFFKFCTVTYQSGETLCGNFLHVYILVNHGMRQNEGTTTMQYDFDYVYFTQWAV